MIVEYLFIADEALIEDGVDFVIEVCEICDEIDNFTV